MLSLGSPSPASSTPSPAPISPAVPISSTASIPLSAVSAASGTRKPRVRPVNFGVQFHGMWSAYDDAERRTVLLVPHEGATLVPSFQLDDQGQVRDELLAVIEPLLAAGVDPWRAWVWLTTPAGLLGGAVPHEAARDPEELPLVQHAAVALAERARDSRA